MLLSICYCCCKLAAVENVCQDQKLYKINKIVLALPIRDIADNICI